MWAHTFSRQALCTNINILRSMYIRSFAAVGRPQSPAVHPFPTVSRSRSFAAVSRSPSPHGRRWSRFPLGFQRKRARTAPTMPGNRKQERPAFGGINSKQEKTGSFTAFVFSTLLHLRPGVFGRLGRSGVAMLSLVAAVGRTPTGAYTHQFSREK